MAIIIIVLLSITILPRQTFTHNYAYLSILLYLQAIAASSILNSFFDRVALLSARLLLQPNEVLSSLETQR